MKEKSIVFSVCLLYSKKHLLDLFYALLVI